MFDLSLFHKNGLKAEMPFYTFFFCMWKLVSKPVHHVHLWLKMFAKDIVQPHSYTVNFTCAALKKVHKLP